MSTTNLLTVALAVVLTACGGADVSRENLEQTPTTDMKPATDPEPRAELCFRPPGPVLVEHYPEFAERAETAAGRWGWTIHWDESCDSYFAVLVGVEPVEEGVPLAENDIVDGFERGAPYEGGASWIGLREERLGAGIIDIVGEEAIEECVEAFKVERTRSKVLVYLLTHEFGHVLTNRPQWHEEDEASVMYYRAWDCFDAEPTAEERAMALLPNQ